MVNTKIGKTTTLTKNTNVVFVCFVAFMIFVTAPSAVGFVTVGEQ
jgi:hypothetical protein